MVSKDIENGYCNFDLIDQYKETANEVNSLKANTRLEYIDGFKRIYPQPEGIRKVNILV